MQPLTEVSLSNESVYSTPSIMKVLADWINPDDDIGPDDVTVGVIWVSTLNTSNQEHGVSTVSVFETKLDSRQILHTLDSLLFVPNAGI